MGCTPSSPGVSQQGTVSANNVNQATRRHSRKSDASLLRAKSNASLQQSAKSNASLKEPDKVDVQPWHTENSDHGERDENTGMNQNVSSPIENNVEYSETKDIGTDSNDDTIENDNAGSKQDLKDDSDENEPALIECDSDEDDENVPVVLELTNDGKEAEKENTEGDETKTPEKDDDDENVSRDNQDATEEKTDTQTNEQTMEGLQHEDTKSDITIQSCHDGESLQESDKDTSTSQSMDTEQKAHIMASMALVSDVMAKAEENVHQIENDVDSDSVLDYSSFTDSFDNLDREKSVEDLDQEEGIDDLDKGGSDMVIATSLAKADEESIENKVKDETGVKEDKVEESIKEENTYDPSVTLPSLPPRQRPADFHCLYAQSRGKWPIRNNAKSQLNVNAGHGGCATLLLCSCSYGGKGEETTSEIFLHRSGFDCNFYDVTSICKNNSGHFGCHNNWFTDEEGYFIGNLMFGNNHVMLMSNDSKNGTCGHGLFVQGEDGESTKLCINVHVNGAGVSLVLCSGMSDGKPVSAAYMVRHGFKDNFFKEVLICGENKWAFEAGEGGILHAKGPKKSTYSIYVNRGELVNTESEVKRSNVSMTQAWDGQEEVTLMENLPEHGIYFVLCSNSKGSENRTAASLYAIMVDTDGKISSKQVVGNHGEDYKSSDLWKFQIANKNLTVTGPSGPCRYAVLSNHSLVGEELCRQDICLATGEPQPIRGAVEISVEGVKGIVQKRSTVQIQVDHQVLAKFGPDDLVQVQDGWAFRRLWKDGEIPVGVTLVRVFMARKHVTTGEEQRLEMTGSPYQIVRQKDKVVYALNCCGPAYTSIDHMTYTSEHRQFANFSYDFNCGSRSFAYGCPKQIASMPHLLNNTQDGFMYVTRRSMHSEPVDEKKIIYTVKDIPNGDYILRFHTEEKSKNVNTIINGKNVTQEIMAAAAKAPTNLTESLTAYYADIPTSVTEDKLVVDTKLHIAGFALLKKDYKDSVKTDKEIQEENKEKQYLMDKIDPLTRSLQTKELKVVGWSPNLLKNATGEAGDLSHWNVTGDIRVREGGHGTEKSFITSHMECTKYQEVNLTEHFSPEYLDTCPDIEISEWYREGVCGGGFYEMEAQLLDGDGNVLKSFEVPRTGRIYKNNAWTQAGTTFTNYPKGVRFASISSMGKDDKYWGGHYGTIISASVIRVKRETTPAVDDSFSDIKLTPGDGEPTWNSRTEKLITKVLTDNKDMMDILLQDEAVPSFDPQFEKQVEIKADDAPKKPQKKRKREVRVFVSSTFKDFNKEREAIIKKAFREINRFCSERGVFFTYVDLRWGISTEQSSHGQTIAICLQEIDRCRPYFIALLGSRFGWSQKKGTNDEALMKTYDYAIENVPNLKWIDDHRCDTSVTQLEILHGVINNVEANKDRSFFYLRKPKKMENLSPDEKKMYSAESEWHDERQMSLRNLVSSKQQLHIREFEDPDEVANKIKEDMLWCIDKDFPKGTELSPLEREREAHEAFAEIRCQVYIGREEYFTTINEYIDKNINQPLVLLGESGCGKSALVANWVKRAREKYPDAFMFVHFIGSSAESADYLKLLRRLYEELKIYFKLELAIPTSDAQLIRELTKWLHLVSNKHQCIIVLDALNQLDSGMKEDGPEHDLAWIPEEIPRNVFMLLSTLPGRAKEAVLSRKWPTMQVTPLEPSQKMEIITGYLEGIYRKTLSDEQKQMIVDAPQTNNPLYLRSLLDEVRVYGSFRTLSQRIQEYLQADNPGDLFAKILERMEGDFSLDEEAQRDLHIFVEKLKAQARLNITKETTTAIWCSNRGMSEGELTELLQVPSAVWSPFYLSLAEGLVNKNGILNFFHDHLRQAVEKKYLSTLEDKKAGYLRLANFFSEKELDDRVVDELPFLLARAGELDRLKALITRFEVFRRMADTEEGKFELIKAWQLLGDYSLVEKEYLNKLSEIPEEEKNTESYMRLLVLLGDFFVDLGLYNGAREVFKKLESDLEHQFAVSHGTVVYNPFNHSWKYRSKHPNVLDALNKLGLICEKLNELNEGEAYYRDAISRQNRIISPSQKLQLCESLLGLATIMNMKNNMPEAKKMLIRSLELATDVLGRQHHFVAAILNKLGALCYSQGRVEEALGYFLQDLKLSRSEVGVSHPRIGRILASVGMVYDDMNDDLAGELYEAALAELLDTYGSTHIDVAKVRFNLGSYYYATNHFAKAKFQFTEAYSTFQSVVGDDHPNAKAAKSALDELP